MERECLSVVMPVYNEKNSILGIINEVLKLEVLKELIIVDDGSNDGTRELLKGVELGSKIKKIFHERNLGKGAALRTGFKVATAEIVVVQDADLEYSPQELVEVTEPIKKGVADVVYGSRLLGGRPQRVFMFWHKLGNNVITLVANLLYNASFTDIETCYKAFKREIIQAINLRSNGFTFEAEVTAKILKRRLRIYEVPISYYGRTYKEGKKITWKQGFSAIFTLLWYRFFG